MRTFVVIALMLLPLFVSTDLRASECDYGPSPCEAYAMADGVFIGKVVKIVPEFIHPSQIDENSDQTAYVAVGKVYKGSKGRRSIVLHQSARDHAETFVYGARYLFYANYNLTEKHWEVRPCGRTRMVSYVHDDLRYLDNLPASAKRTRIAGEVVRSYSSAEIGRTTEPVSGLRIKITGESHEYQVITDSNGIYELYDVAPGGYSVEPEIPKGDRFLMALHYGPHIRLKTNSLQVELKAGECTGVTILIEPLGKEKRPTVVASNADKRFADSR
jgi:hypothetical protein